MNFDFSTKLLKKGAPPKAAPVKKAAAPKRMVSRPTPRPTPRSTKTATQPVLSGGAGYRRYKGEALWLPNTSRPEWLDGSLPGDRGFDPLGLAKPVEYLQFDLDQLDQNQSQNKAGNVIGTFKPK